MIEYRMRFTYEGSARGLKRAQKRALKEEWGELLLYWHARYLPFHFQERAYHRYAGDYTFRTARWNRRKGHSKPMVGPYRAKGATPAGGYFMRQVTGQITVRRRRNGARGVMTGDTRILNIHGGRGTHDFRREITATSPKEEAALARRLDVHTTRRMKRDRRRRVKIVA